MKLPRSRYEAPLVKMLRKVVSQSENLKPHLKEILLAYDEAVIRSFPLILEMLEKESNKSASPR